MLLDLFLVICRWQLLLTFSIALKLTFLSEFLGLLNFGKGRFFVVLSPPHLSWAETLVPDQQSSYMKITYCFRQHMITAIFFGFFSPLSAFSHNKVQLRSLVRIRFLVKSAKNLWILYKHWVVKDFNVEVWLWIGDECQMKSKCKKMRKVLRISGNATLIKETLFNQ